jgi:hypothetical protein
VLKCDARDAQRYLGQVKSEGCSRRPLQLALCALPPLRYTAVVAAAVEAHSQARASWPGSAPYSRRRDAPTDAAAAAAAAAAASPGTPPRLAWRPGGSGGPGTAEEGRIAVDPQPGEGGAELAGGSAPTGPIFRVGDAVECRFPVKRSTDVPVIMPALPKLHIYAHELASCVHAQCVSDHGRAVGVCRVGCRPAETSSTAQWWRRCTKPCLADPPPITRLCGMVSCCCVVACALLRASHPDMQGGRALCGACRWRSTASAPAPGKHSAPHCAPWHWPHPPSGIGRSGAYEYEGRHPSSSSSGCCHPGSAAVADEF